MRHPFAATRTAVLVGCLALGGCALNPLAPRDMPGTNVQVSGNLSLANAYADARRDGYLRQLEDEARTSSMLNSGLIGMGALALGLAAGGAHRDAMLGIGLVGGTAYALGSVNLSKQRLLVLQSGIEAIDCAKRAVLPLAMTTAQEAHLAAAVQALAAAQSETTAASAAVQQALVPYLSGGAETSLSKEARDALAAAAASLQAATLAEADGRKLAARSGRVGEELKAAVDQIHAAVNRALIATLAELSAVRDVIGSLGSYAAAVAPGSAKAVTAAVDKAKARDGLMGAAAAAAAPKPRPGEAELRSAVARLQGDELRLRSAVGTVQAALAPHLQAVEAADGLRACGVADPTGPMNVNVATLHFSEGLAGSKFVLVQGGQPPYSAQLLQAEPAGLAVREPLIGESRVTVTTTAATPASGPLSLAITDRSNPPRSVSVAILIDAPAPAAERKRTAVGPAPVGEPRPVAVQPSPFGDGDRKPGQVQTLQALVLRLEGLQGKPVAVGETDGGRIRFTVARPPKLAAGGQGIDVDVRFGKEPNAPACLARNVVRSRLVAAAAPGGVAAGLVDKVALSSDPADGVFCP